MADKYHISATQITAFIDCARKWFFSYVLKLVTEKGYPFTYGIVFHGVAERYLKSDDTCSDLVLYPKGWLETDNGVVTDADGEWIKSLMTAAIEAGIFEKYKGREIEKKFTRSLTETTDITGYIDLRLPNENKVVDHKTTKDFKYALSMNGLAQDVQMLIYAGVHAIEWMEETGEELQTVTLRHNQFQKEKHPKVKFTEVDVSIDIINDNWERCAGISDEMEGWRFTTAENWDKVPGPDDISICNKYSGCPFMRICGKTETIPNFKKRINRILDNVGKPLGEKPMGLFDKVKKKAPVEPAPEVSAPEGQPVEETADQEVFKSPPWAWRNCVACEGTGLNSKGNPCGTCNANANKNKLPASSHYMFSKEHDGWIIAEDEKPAPKKKEKEETLATVDPEKVKNAGLKKALKAKQGRTTVENGEAKRGRPPKGFTLCISCVPTDCGSRVVESMDLIFKQAKEMAEKAMGGPFYELDQWKRKDALSVAVSHLAEELGPVYIVATNGNGLDYKACLDALRSSSAVHDTIEGLH